MSTVSRTIRFRMSRIKCFPASWSDCLDASELSSALRELAALEIWALGD